MFSLFSSISSEQQRSERLEAELASNVQRLSEQQQKLEKIQSHFKKLRNKANLLSKVNHHHRFCAWA